MKEVDIKLLSRTITPKRAANLASALSSYLLSWLFKKPLLFNKPAILTVEPTNYCNLHCPQCHTGAGKINRPLQHLPLAEFKRIIDELGDSLIYLILFNQGEPYLHPQLIDFIRYAKSKNIYVTTSTNGHFFDRNSLVEGTLDSGLDTLIISLDGADAATYEKYRHGGSFSTVTAGIRALAAEKARRRSSTPRLIVQFLLMRHNEDQVEQIKVLARELGADKVLLKTLQVDSADEAEQFLPQNDQYRRYVLDRQRLRTKRRGDRPCRRLWLSSVVNSDGAVVPCCFDKQGHYSFGDLDGDLPFAGIWRSPAYNEFREHILKKHDIDICKNCTEGTKIFF